MVTTIIKAIKAAGGGDYSTLGSWEAARRGNIVTRDTIEIAEIYDATTTGVGFLPADWTVDASHYIWIRAAAGYGHLGVFNNTTRASFNGVPWCSVGYVRIGPGLSIYDVFGTGIKFSNISTDATCIVDGCIIGAGTPVVRFDNCPVTTNANRHVVKNCVIIKRSLGDGAIATRNGNTKIKVYNCTIRIIDEGVSSVTFLPETGTDIISENNYLGSNSRNYFLSWGGTITKGANDATKNTEAITPSLQSIAYSTANFISVTLGSEDLHILKTGALYNTGANLTSEGVTTDYEGTTRPQFGDFDIGAHEFGIPICWNYTARYRGSNKLFKASGCGPFPKTLQVPSNVDTSTGKMIDDGVFISPDKYEII